MNGTINREVAKKPGYHAGDDLLRLMMINLTNNNANPEAIEAAKDAKELALAGNGKAPDPAMTPNAK